MLSHVSWTRQVSSSSPYPRVLIPRKSGSLADGLAPPLLFLSDPFSDFTYIYALANILRYQPHDNSPYIIASRL